MSDNPGASGVTKKVAPKLFRCDACSFASTVAHDLIKHSPTGSMVPHNQYAALVWLQHESLEGAEWIWLCNRCTAANAEVDKQLNVSPDLARLTSLPSAFRFAGSLVRVHACSSSKSVLFEIPVEGKRRVVSDGVVVSAPAFLHTRCTLFALLLTSCRPAQTFHDNLADFSLLYESGRSVLQRRSGSPKVVPITPAASALFWSGKENEQPLGVPPALLLKRSLERNQELRKVYLKQETRPVAEGGGGVKLLPVFGPSKTEGDGRAPTLFAGLALLVAASQARGRYLECKDGRASECTVFTSFFDGAKFCDSCARERNRANRNAAKARERGTVAAAKEPLAGPFELPANVANLAGAMRELVDVLDGASSTDAKANVRANIAVKALQRNKYQCEFLAGQCMITMHTRMRSDGSLGVSNGIRWDSPLMEPYLFADSFMLSGVLDKIPFITTPSRATLRARSTACENETTSAVVEYIRPHLERLVEKFGRGSLYFVVTFDSVALASSLDVSGSIVTGIGEESLLYNAFAASEPPPPSAADLSSQLVLVVCTPCGNVRIPLCSRLYASKGSGAAFFTEQLFVATAYLAGIGFK
jgi:hypothetical protein